MLFGIPFGSVGGADYGSVRAGAFMGRKMIQSTASGMLPQSLPSSNGINNIESEVDGVELLEAEASLDYLCNLSPHRYSALMDLPAEFLEIIVTQDKINSEICYYL